MLGAVLEGAGDLPTIFGIIVGAVVVVMVIRAISTLRK
jgi:hypothetical protein